VDWLGESKLSIRDAHYDLLTRCLSSVHLNVREEVDISMDRTVAGMIFQKLELNWNSSSSVTSGDERRCDNQ
jgi:hypothetical protein